MNIMYKVRHDTYESRPVHSIAETMPDICTHANQWYDRMMKLTKAKLVNPIPMVYYIIDTQTDLEIIQVITHTNDEGTIIKKKQEIRPCIL